MKSNRIGMLVLVAAALAGMSCQEPMRVSYAEMIEPKVTDVNVLAGTLTINIGFMDDVHAGQSLFITRNNKAVARLVVRDLQEYTAQCSYVKLPGQLVGPVNGDVVVRKLSDVARPRTLRDRVPRFVQVPYDPDNTVIQVGERRVRIRDRMISREKYDELKKKWEAEKVGATD